MSLSPLAHEPSPLSGRRISALSAYRAALEGDRRTTPLGNDGVA